MTNIYKALSTVMHDNWVIEDDVIHAIRALKEYYNCQYEWMCSSYAHAALKYTQRAMSGYYSYLTTLRKYNIKPPCNPDAVYKALDRLYDLTLAATYDA